MLIVLILVKFMFQPLFCFLYSHYQLDLNIHEFISEQYPPMNDLVFELTDGVKKAWLKNEQLLSFDSSVKYALLHKIGVVISQIRYLHESHQLAWYCF